MLCTRCQQREATTFRRPSPESQAKARAMFGAELPFPENICDECTSQLFKDPEFRARWDEFMKGVRAYNDKQFSEMVESVRSQVLRVLDFADKLVGKP